MVKDDQPDMREEQRHSEDDEQPGSACIQVSKSVPTQAEELPNSQGDDNNVLRVDVSVPVLLYYSGD